MPHNFGELEQLLAASKEEHRAQLAQIIGAPFGASAGHICDHLNYLRYNAVGQFITRKNYKQLVTDVADRVGINWPAVLGSRTWHDLSPIEIEQAIAARVERVGIKADQESPDSIGNKIADFLTALLLRKVPMARPAAPFVQKTFSQIFDRLNPDWRALVAGIVFIHDVIRKKPLDR